MENKQAEELTPQDYLNKVKAAYDIKQSLETLFVVCTMLLITQILNAGQRDESEQDRAITVDSLIKNKKNALYMKGVLLWVWLHRPHNF